MKTLARRSDPLTSYLAADRVKLFAGSHRERILCALRFLKQATPAEIGQLSGLSVEQTDRRLPELQRAHKARVAQRNGVNVIRNGYRVWELV